MTADEPQVNYCIEGTHDAIRAEARAAVLDWVADLEQAIEAFESEARVSRRWRGRKVPIVGERDRAVTLANRVLDNTGLDPDSDIVVLARQLLRAAEDDPRKVDSG
jgi:hypothetical protein